MPKFGPSIKILLINKDKLCKLARTPLYEHCLAVLLKKLPEKLGDPSKFLIPCDFPRKAECLALADLNASINLVPLSVWNKLYLPDLTPTCMTLELADRSISHPVGVAEDVYVKVGSFHFPANFVVIDFDADPRVPLILERSFLKIRRALIDVFERELTIHFGKEAISFNLDQTSRYSANYNEMTAKQIDVIDMACEEYSQEVLGFLIDFLLEEVDAFLAIKDDPTSPKVDQSYLDPEGDILLLEAFFNDDSSLPPPNQGNYLPEVCKELKIYEAKFEKSSIDEPLEVELKDLPPHLKYAFLEGDDKLPVIIAKYLSVEEKTALITVLKSHNPWVSPVHCVAKMGGFTVVENKENELILTRLVMGWRVYINEATSKDHFSLPFMNQMLERLARNQYYCFLGGFSGYFQIPIDLKDKVETTFTYPYGTFAYRRMPFVLCNAPGTFQRCMMAIFHDMIKKTMEVFMDDFLVFRNSFQSCLSYLERMLKRFIKDFSKIARPMTRLLEKDTPFIFSKEYVEAFQTLKRKQTEAPILIAPDWDMPFEVMCDASDFAIGAVLGQRQDKHFRPIHYASKTITEAEYNYIITKKEMLAVVYAFEKFLSYLIMNKRIIYTDHSALKHLFPKKIQRRDCSDGFYSSRNSHSKFGTPRAIISDRVTHFCNDQFAKVMQKFGVTHHLATPFHPQTSGQVEESNRGLKRIFGRTVGKNRASWSDKLDDALWAFRTAYKTPIRKVQLNELCDQAYENSLIYKEKTKRLHDSKIKDRVFNIGNRVLFNSQLKIFSDKLKSRWSGPFTISHVYSYGTVELAQPDGPNFKVNSHRLKHYFEEDVPKMVVPDLQTFPKDH
nr:DNA-directed DNA polymerase [Tanacetum cinerariifolium]